MFDGLAALTRESFNWSRPDRPEQLPGARVSASFFDVLALDVAVGRRFVAGDDVPGGPAVGGPRPRLLDARVQREPPRRRHDV